MHDVSQQKIEVAGKNGLHHSSSMLSAARSMAGGWRFGSSLIPEETSAYQSHANNIL
jgi:hypothetical protein